MPTPYKKYEVEARIYDKDNNITDTVNFVVEAKTFRSAEILARGWLFEHNINKAMFDIRKDKEIHERYIQGVNIQENRKMYRKEIENDPRYKDVLK